MWNRAPKPPVAAQAGAARARQPVGHDRALGVPGRWSPSRCSARSSSGGERRPIDLAILILTYIMLGWGLNIVVGLAGLLDLGYVAFYAVGAYSYALLSTVYFPYGSATASCPGPSASRCRSPAFSRHSGA